MNNIRIPSHQLYQNCPVLAVVIKHKINGLLSARQGADKMHEQSQSIALTIVIKPALYTYLQSHKGI